MFRNQFVKSLQFMLACSLFSFGSVYADVPLTVEGLLTDKGKLKLDMTVSYANSEKSNASTGDYVNIQTGPTSFVTFPTKVGDGVINSDGRIQVRSATRFNEAWNTSWGVLNPSRFLGR